MRKTRDRGLMAIAAIAVLVGVACGAEGPAGPPGPPGPAGPPGPPGADAEACECGAPDGGVAPIHAPVAIAFTDRDPIPHELDGIVTITRAADESDVTGYALYYGTSATQKLYLSPIAIVPANGADARYELVREGSPHLATHLLAFSMNAAGEMATGVSTPISELGQSRFVDISAGQGVGSANEPSAVIDPAAGKLLVATDNGATGDRLGLYRTNLDGSGATYADISAGQGAGSGFEPSAVLHAPSGKLLVVTDSIIASQRPALFRCNLDGTGCTHTDISAGQGVQSGSHPSAAIDVAGGKLLAVTTNFANGQRPSLFRCNLDGTACTHTDVSAGRGQNTGYNPFALVDAANAKLLVVTDDATNDDKPALFRCNLDGTGCTYADISAGQGSMSGVHPSAVIDKANAKLLVVTMNFANDGRPSLFRCNLDGTACTHTDVSAGQGANSGNEPVALIDDANAKLLVVTQNDANGGRPALFRCNLDGSACAYFDIAAGTGEQSGTTPSAVIDKATGDLLVVTRNVNFLDVLNRNKLGLFQVRLR